MKITVNKWRDYQPRKDCNNTKWFRLESSLFESRKMFELSGEEIACFVAILCQCSKINNETVEIDLKHISYMTRLKEESFESMIQKLKSNQVLTVTERDVYAKNRYVALHNITEHNITIHNKKKEANASLPSVSCSTFVSKYKEKGYAEDFLNDEWNRFEAYCQKKNFAPDWSKAAGWFSTKWTKGRWSVYQTDHNLKPDPMAALFEDLLAKKRSEREAANV